MKRIFGSIAFMTATFTIFLVVFCSAQLNDPENPTQQKYLAEKEALNNRVSLYFSENQELLFRLPEEAFVMKIDSLRNLFTSQLDSFTHQNQDLEKEFIRKQQDDLRYSFDAKILSYPYWHERETGIRVELSDSTQNRLDQNLAGFNKPELLSNESFIAYVDGFLYFKSNLEREKPVYRNTDNQKLNSLFHIIPEYFTDQICRDFWSYKCLDYHIVNLGIKNIDLFVNEFKAICKDTSLVNKIDSLYSEEQKGMTDHLIRSYKSVGSGDLDLHLFLPEKGNEGEKRPVYVYFHGGAWTEGKPDWGFFGCQSYAKKGWVAVSVEYRINDRQGTLPFDAVKDARSAIRWIRKHADDFNIDVNRIVATGNSAGGHLVLCTALADKWNEDSDDRNYSAIPDLLLVNSGVFDLTNESWITKDLEDKETVKEISPNFLVRKRMPPTLIIHGMNDHNVPFRTALIFEAKMKEANNDFEFHALDKAGHFFWFDDSYSQKVSQFSRDFLKKHGYQ